MTQDIKPVGSGQSPIPSKESNGKNAQDLERMLQEYELENEQLRNGYMSLSQQLIGLRMVQHIAQDLVSELDVDRLLQRILRSAINAVNGTAGSLLLLDPTEQHLVFAVVEGGGGETLQGQSMRKDQGMAGWVLLHNEPLLVADVQEDERFFDKIPNGVDYEVKSQICVPLVAKGSVIGVIQILNKTQTCCFDDDDLNLLTSFAAQSATAIENARLYQDLKRERDRLIALEEQVRRRLARDLHDGPAQLLAALITNLGFVRKLLVHEPAKVPRELEGMLPVAEKALRQVRTLLFDLRPVILETKGLVPALKSYVRQQQDGESPTYHLQVSGFSGRLVPPAEQTIFSIIQEAIGNVKRHAQAQNVWIAVAEHDGRLVVGVRDDGQGFDVDKLNAEYDQRGSLGMLNMQERAQVIAGRLTVRSHPGQGTTIALTVPLKPLRPDDSPSA